MTEKLTLQSTVALALASGWPIEVVQGQARASRRAHLLINHPAFPELYIVFGDAAHGFLFDSAWSSLRGGGKLRLKEADVREHLATEAPLDRWTREVPPVESPLHLTFAVTNPDLAEVSFHGRVLSITSDELVVSHPLLNGESTELTLKTAPLAPVGATVSFTGIYRYPFTVVDVVVTSATS
jgi:hypothetical protein